MNRIVSPHPMSIILIFFLGLILSAQPAAAQNNDSLFLVARNQVGDIELDGIYSESLGTNNLYFQELIVSVRNAPIGSRVTVKINGRKVGVIEVKHQGTNAFLTQRLDVPVGKDGRPRGPRVNIGDIVSVHLGRRSLEAPFKLF